MKLLQAAICDRAARSWREHKVYYRVGSVFKGCANCGDTEEEKQGSGRIVVRYTSGFQVFRSYDPAWVGWTWWCYECGAKDLRAWAPDQLGLVEAQLGKPPVQGAREVIAAHKYVLRKKLMKFNPRTAVPRASSRVSEIARLEAEVARLMTVLKGGR